MDNRSEEFIRIRVRGNRKWRLLGIIIAIICFAVLIGTAVWLSKHFNRIQSDLKPIINDTSSNIEIEYKNYTLPDTVEYDISSGRSLGHALYTNPNIFSLAHGYVSHLYIRLFTYWYGNAPLYIFIIISGFPLEIIHRYPVEPRRNTTEWQVISIPANILPINQHNLVGVGMQDESETNQIYGIRKTIGFGAMDITKNTTHALSLPDFTKSVAFGFTIAHNRT
ncbi:hypothetical protein I4U23_001309 [Adineta vaga]|nr:hypothetical protein I4U23_001309 [Adineta vaga]